MSVPPLPYLVDGRHSQQRPEESEAGMTGRADWVAPGQTGPAVFPPGHQTGARQGVHQHQGLQGVTAR